MWDWEAKKEYKLCQVEVSSPSYRQEHIVYLVLTYTCQYLGWAREIVEKGRLKLQSLHYLAASNRVNWWFRKKVFFFWIPSFLTVCWEFFLALLVLIYRLQLGLVLRSWSDGLAKWKITRPPSCLKLYTGQHIVTHCNGKHRIETHTERDAVKVINTGIGPKVTFTALP